MGKLLTLIAVLAVALSMAGMMVYSAVEVRATVRLEPELERQALAYLKEEVRRQEETKKPAVITLEPPTPAPKTSDPEAFSDALHRAIHGAPKLSPHVTPTK